MSNALDELQHLTFARATRATNSSYPAERQLSGTDLTTYLDERVFAVMGTTRPDGRPHSAMTSYFREDTSFWLPTVAGSVRERNIRHQPWVSLVIPHGEHDDHMVVLLEGSATVVPLEDVPPGIHAKADSEWVKLWIRVEARRLLSYGKR